MTDITEWISKLKPRILEFLKRLRHPEIKGFYSYSMSGDTFNPVVVRWGLGNTVFAAKTYYMLDALDHSNIEEMATFIKSFQTESSEIYDPLIEKKSVLRRLLNSVRELDLNNIRNQQTRRAETRQAFAALRCLQSKPNIPYKHIPYTKADIRKYVQALNWKQPWGAGSHVSHLLFFLNNNRLLFDMHKKDTDGLIDYVFEIINNYRQEDGSWYSPKSNLPVHFKVNAAMKIMTAYDATGRDDFSYPKKLIDLCLSSVNDGDACNNFNIICVLYHCARKTDYRADEIKEYCLKKLQTYRKHYWPDHGGFSFFEQHANSVYYGAKISRGLKEPDIHGTHLFLWGITLITKILNLNNKIKFRIPIT
ncbi:MAG: hypothetical protein ACUZ8N_15430 [Candidatus Scalindua sp.]